MKKRIGFFVLFVVFILMFEIFAFASFTSAASFGAGRTSGQGSIAGKGITGRAINAYAVGESDPLYYINGDEEVADKSSNLAGDKNEMQSAQSGLTPEQQDRIDANRLDVLASKDPREMPDAEKEEARALIKKALSNPENQNTLIAAKRAMMDNPSLNPFTSLSPLKDLDSPESQRALGEQKMKEAIAKGGLDGLIAAAKALGLGVANWLTGGLTPEAKEYFAGENNNGVPTPEKQDPYTDRLKKPETWGDILVAAALVALPFLRPEAAAVKAGGGILGAGEKATVREAGETVATGTKTLPKDIQALKDAVEAKWVNVGSARPLEAPAARPSGETGPSSATVETGPPRTRVAQTSTPSVSADEYYKKRVDEILSNPRANAYIARSEQAGIEQELARRGIEVRNPESHLSANSGPSTDHINIKGSNSDGVSLDKKHILITDNPQDPRLKELPISSAPKDEVISSGPAKREEVTPRKNLFRKSSYRSDHPNAGIPKKTYKPIGGF